MSDVTATSHIRWSSLNTSPDKRPTQRLNSTAALVVIFTARLLLEKTPPTSSSNARMLCSWETSILWRSRIDLVCPGRFPTLEILDSFKSTLLEHPVGVSTVATHLAVHDNVVLAVQPRHPRRELAQGDELRTVGFEIANPPFVRVAHVPRRPPRSTSLSAAGPLPLY
jgi:hypothetical protein